MPMVEELQAGSQIKGRCWLIKDGEMATKNAWFTVSNQYAGDMEPVFEAERREAEVFHLDSSASGVSSSLLVLLAVLAACYN